MEISFNLMIIMHAAEVDYYYPNKHTGGDEGSARSRQSIVAPTATDPYTLKPVHPDDIPVGCTPSDVHTKWLLDDLDTIYADLTANFLLNHIFEKEERLVHDVFIHKLAREHTDFLKSHQVRKIVFSRLVDRMFNSTQKKTDSTTTTTNEESKQQDK